MDLTELERNIAYYGLPQPFLRPLLYYDVQKLFSLEYGDGSSRMALDLAAAEKGLAQEARFTGRLMMPATPQISLRKLIWNGLEFMYRWIIISCRGKGRLIGFISPNIPNMCQKSLKQGKSCLKIRK